MSEIIKLPNIGDFKSVQIIEVLVKNGEEIIIVQIAGLIARRIVCEVEQGQDLKQGERIGTVGKTGRSTGPHLDIRLNWFDVKLDPASVLKLN